MIGVDWGTTSLRAWRLALDGTIIESRASPRGIMTITDRRFEPVLREIAGDWLAEGEDKVMLCGMIGSRQGWQEAPYLRCPAGIDAIARNLTPVAFAGAQVLIVPGLVSEDADGVPDVMRGEETQILGVGGAAAGLPICLPGTHSKWASVVDGRIERFDTYMTGDVFAAIAGYTILARTLQAGPIDMVAFGEGLARATQPGGLLHHAFGVRTRVLRSAIDEAFAYGYLSGLLIGHELNVALAGAARVAVVGASGLAGLYAAAIAARGGAPVLVDEAACAAGLAALGARASWI